MGSTACSSWKVSQSIGTATAQVVPEMGTQVFGLGLQSDSSPNLVGLGLKFYTSGLGLDLRHADLHSTRTSGLRLDSANSQLS